jgi:hypothetical protein
LRVDLRRKKPIEKFSKLFSVLLLLLLFPNLTSVMTALLALALAVTS